MKFIKTRSGQTIAAPLKKWVIACCDCGLVHTLEFKKVRPVRREILIKVTRKARLTIQRRKDLVGKLNMVPK